MIYQTAKQICEQTDQHISNIFKSISNLCQKHSIKPTSIDFEIKDSKLHSLLINDLMFTRGKSNHWERV
ncbi:MULTISPECIES: hypothetical protein [unclassified Aeromonas]|uniref:hypothetical protein n=1 Tax=unclassified Aeromonas TaxID=257493 RepID=UPI00084A56EF|nr:MULTISPECIES: hypothetical protein [unclassified Aeromonas]OEC41378.1 hypothetical protein A9G06_13770 [Aeromonas sp. DNP9]OEC48746.1 hypothetical protein A9G04_20915 [Aeromonas sp. ANNP30]OEC60787.1 hypothetical protein A9G49_20980 [Aeromonas sp. ANP5]